MAGAQPGYAEIIASVAQVCQVCARAREQHAIALILGIFTHFSALIRSRCAGELRAKHLHRRQQARQRHGAGALGVVVEGTQVVAVAIEQPPGVVL
ncbi:MAG: hypothetical protein ACJ8CR_08675 [Roseiflexaceae bacterium]